MVINKNDQWNKAVIYPHATNAPTINTAGDVITITNGGKVLFNGSEWTAEEAARYTDNLKKAFDAAFEISDK